LALQNCCSKIDFPFAAPNYTTLAIDSGSYMTWATSPKVELNNSIHIQKYLVKSTC